MNVTERESVTSLAGARTVARRAKEDPARADQARHLAAAAGQTGDARVFGPQTGAAAYATSETDLDLGLRK